MDVVQPLDSTEDLLRCVALHCSADNDDNYINIKIILNPRKPPAPRYKIVHFHNIKSVVQENRLKCRIADDLLRIQRVTDRFRLYQFVKLDSAVEEKSQDAVWFD